MKQSSFDFSEVAKYLKTRVLPIIQPLQMDILEHKPTDIKSFAYVWLQNYKQNQSRVKHKQSLNNQDDDQDPQQVYKERIKKRKQYRNRRRVGVLGQSTTTILQNTQNNDDVQENMTFARTQQSKIKLLVELKNSVLFKDMNHSSIQKIIQMMKIRQFNQGQIVIREGDHGNQLFFVDEGSFRCIFSEKKTQQKIYGAGQIFGQLALLYNTKRASTIAAQTDGRLYSLGRNQFNLIIREKVKQKTQMCQRILKNVQIFQTLDRYQKSKVYEAFKEIQIMAGKYVIKQGQIGDSFYIVAEGKLVAEKNQDGELTPVYYYKQGDYFGQLAIMKNIVRQASVKALTKVRLLYIQRNSFKRLLGSIQNILRRNQMRYKNSPKTKNKKRKGSLDKLIIS